MNCIVVGDTILDSYLIANVERFAQEAPLLFDIIDEKHQLGGAANVAYNARKIYDSVYYLSVIGANNYVNSIIKALLKASDIHHVLVEEDKRITPVKTRIVFNNNIYLRFDKETVQQISGAAESEFLDNLGELLISNFDVLYISDYGKFLTQSIVEEIKEFKSKSLFVAADIKPKNAKLFENCEFDLIKLNFNEAVRILNDISNIKYNIKLSSADYLTLDESIMFNKFLYLRDYFSSPICVTLGKKGAVFIDLYDNVEYSPQKHVENSSAIGAGDVFFVVLTYFLVQKKSVDEALSLANEITAKAIAQSKFTVTIGNIIECYR